jgi:dTDP-3-amino-3,4,6-trideoxy-alpha-D-glucose transaminase
MAAETRIAVESVPAPRIRLLDLTREYRVYHDELLAACERVLDGMHLLGGAEVASFEAEMASYLDVARVRGVASGTDALHLALRALGLGPGDEVLVQANAFVAAVEAIRLIGATPVAVDVREDDLGPDPDEVAARLTPRTRAVLVVHLHGLPADLVPILALARRHDLAVVEDCSHAHGATLDGRRVGAIGTIGAFSLGVVKNLAAYGDAGMIATGDAALADRVRHLGTHGQATKNTHAFYGTNSRLDELHAAMLRVKLRHLDERNARRRAIADRYSEHLRDLLTVPLVCARREPVYHQYVVRTDRREALQAHLDRYGIDTGIHYPRPIHRQAAWRDAFGEPPSLPRAERLASEMLSLPVYPDLTDTEIERVIQGVRSFFA